MDEEQYPTYDEYLIHLAGERAAKPGELCTCGRPAKMVYVTAKFGPIGSCERNDAGRGGPQPCPFCLGTIRHEMDRCPMYRLVPRHCGCCGNPEHTWDHIPGCPARDEPEGDKCGCRELGADEWHEIDPPGLDALDDEP
jgi:hypothetical protein